MAEVIEYFYFLSFEYSIYRKIYGRFSLKETNIYLYLESRENKFLSSRSVEYSGNIEGEVTFVTSELSGA